MSAYIPAFIMFMITVGVASLFMVPVTRFQMKNKLVNFYWCGFWVFLAIITAVAGGANALTLARVDAMALSTGMLTGIMASFVLFVMFAWFRLSATAIWAGIMRLRTSLANKA